MDYNFYTETNFKQTEIGEIPEDWDVVRLGVLKRFNFNKISGDLNYDPDYQTIMLPLLKEIKDGKEYHFRQVVEKLAGVFGLTEEERRKLLPRG